MQLVCNAHSVCSLIQVIAKDHPRVLGIRDTESVEVGSLYDVIGYNRT